MEASAGTSSLDPLADAPPRHARWALLRHGWRDPLLRRMLALADTGAAIAASSVLVLSGAGLPAAAWSLLLLPIWILAAKLYGLYDRDQRALRHVTVDELPGLTAWATTCIAVILAALDVSPAPDVGLGAALPSLGTAILVALVLRVTARFAWRQLTPPERTLIVGSGDLTQGIRRKLELFADIHARVVGEWESVSIDDLQRREEDELEGLDRLIIASSTLDERLIADLVAYCRHRQTKLSVVPPARGVFGTAVQLKHVGELPVIEYNTWDVSRSTLLLKRVLDLAAATVGIVVVSPLFILIALAIGLTSRGPVFFRQQRGGIDGRPFTMLKFRTMVVDAEQLLLDLVPFEELREPVFKLVQDPRVTRVGRVLRRTSLDELPQLFNILKGEMSLVGPRPEQVELVERYAPEHRFRLAVRPGLTGPMQVFGRGHLALEERLAVERDYIENLSLSRDLRILALTIPSVLTGRGAY